MAEREDSTSSAISEQQKDGEAVVVLQRGVYKGQLANGVAQGEGTFEAKEGDVYKGQWKKNQADGRGRYSGRDGRTYDGQWSHDTQHGQGVETWADGIRYEGQFKEGQKHGAGKFTWKDGSSYDGQFLNNNIHGEGLYIWKNGRQYSGQWRNAKMHGKGRYTFATGCLYEGEYNNDLKSGEGSFTWPDGHTYTGQWRGGRQHGSGTLSWPSKEDGVPGKSEKGKWVNGRRIVEQVWMSPAASCTESLRSGQGSGGMDPIRESQSVASKSQGGETESFYSGVEDDPEVGVETAASSTPAAEVPGGVDAPEGSWRLLSRLFPRSAPGAAA